MSAIQELINAGNTTINNLLLVNIGRLKMTGDEFLLWTNIRMYQEKGIQFPATKDLADNTGLTADQIYQVLQSLLNKQFIKINSAADQKQVYQDCYDLTPLYQQLLGQPIASQETLASTNSTNQLQILFQKIEVEFGRPLSPIERQTIQEWLTQDHYDPELITLALREAVLNQVYSLKYMDRILLNWEKHNIKTVAQLQQQKDRFGDY
ncbi:DnaD domain-containing protein [Bombilactobacillus thymidiniphilus]|uniref:DnaD domain protein n=1 Tax=Bombilactobacillus thymidiniphilus TaxID=2923363 RepID=A0ABY4PDB5_9LACO|nr:DnaD domain protein [Bombilactobacillus thymidiniphilus]UQS83565.1 DnaD domain protein [Bombilactobacillus thymidiniphilus]